MHEPFRHPQAPKLLLPLPTLPNSLLSALSLGMSLLYKLSPSLAAPHPAGRDTVSLAPFQTQGNFSLETCPSLVQRGCGAQAILGSPLPSQKLKGPKVSSGWTLLLTAQTSQGQALWCHLLGPGSGMKDAKARCLSPWTCGHHTVITKHRGNYKSSVRRATLLRRSNNGAGKCLTAYQKEGSQWETVG